MKKLLIIPLLLLVLGGCDSANQCPPDTRGTVITVNSKGETDTLDLEYYRYLHIGSASNLVDGNNNIQSLDVAAFSIIKSEKIGK